MTDSSSGPLRIAVIGTDGLPARYGGFETCVEQLAPRLARRGHATLVFGSSVGRTALAVDGERLAHRYLPLRANGLWSVPYDLLNFLVCWRKADAMLVMGVSGGIFLPLLRLAAGRRRIIVNVDGLETRRDKWTGFKRWFLERSEALAVRHAHVVVSDNQGIADMVLARYGRTSSVIAYGCDHVLQLAEGAAQALIKERFGLAPGSYLLTVARIEPENHIAEMLQAFLASPQPLYVLVGNFSATPLGRELLARYQGEPRVRFIDSLFDPEALAALRAGCHIYLHGHSVGGTNPSLVEMLPYQRPLLAFDCIFNRYTLGDEGGYFADVSMLTRQLQSPQESAWVPGPSLAQRYRWEAIADAYEALCSAAGATP
jgi:glycosyltransferase involved in cell wall biosynthesis